MAKRVNPKPPEFATESDEADWWASDEGRAFLKQQKAPAKKRKGAALVAKLGGGSSVPIVLRLPVADLVKVREVAA